MTGDVSDVTHRKCGLRFEKSQLIEFCLGRRQLTFGARRSQDSGLAAGVARGFGADGKVSIERWYLSPYVEKPFNSKVLKSFVPELRSRKCFLCFGIPMLYMCVINIMNVLRTGMNMSISRIHVLECYNKTILLQINLLCIFYCLLLY